MQLDSTPDIRVVGEATNGIDAVSVTRAEAVNVVVMDMQMPDLTGAQATRELLSSASKHPVAVIVMTSFAVDQYVSDALDAGAVGYPSFNTDCS